MTALESLISLELSMRVTDTFLSKLFGCLEKDSKTCQLTNLVLYWAEISDDGLQTIAKHCTRLEHLIVKLPDMNSRSRYQRMGKARI